MTDQPATLSIEAAQDEEADTKRFAAQLQKDARSWSTREDSGERAAEATLAVAAKAARAAVPRKRRAAAAPAAAAPAANTKSKPFTMSYEGQTTSQYLASRLARGAR
jgi:hypothetical protein